LKFRIHEQAGPAWDSLIEQRGCVYQSWAFGSCLEEGLGQRILRLAVEDADGVRAALSVAVIKSPLFGRFAVSLPISDHSGLCWDDESALARLLEELPALLRGEGLDSMEIRHLQHDAPSLELPRSDHKLTLELALPPDAEVLWDQLKAKVRNLVRKGEKAGLHYRQAGGEELDAFYRVYARNLRDLGTPCYPERFFAALLHRFPRAARLHFASFEERGTPIAVGLTLRDGARQQIPFAASLSEHRRHSPNMFLYWKMLEDAIEGGATHFDFGRSSRDSGTHRFKLQWGAEERALPWFYVLAPGARIPQTRVDSPRYRLAQRVWSRLPVGVATRLGGRLVRYLP
jgi:FemAB-related protein (PEP-CTERM system-associated)